MNVKILKPPSCSPAATSVVFIGRNGRGNWVAREQNGTFGGLFVSREQAFKYALSENGHHPETIVEVTRELELDIPRGEQVTGARRGTDCGAEEGQMAELSFATDHEQVVDIMIALTRPSTLDGVFITGSESMELYLSLRRRGFGRVATPATRQLSSRRYAIGLVAGQNLMPALEQASPFLTINSVIAVLIESREGDLSMKIRNRLQEMGFGIEAGVRCRRGLVLFACRHGFCQMRQAA